MRITAGGDAGSHGGPAGDLFVHVKVKNHSHFDRDEEDLIYTCPIPVWTATVGGKAEVPLIEGGRTAIKIPEGTQHGKIFRVPGKGMPVRGGSQRGDLLVKVRVEVPTELTQRQKELFEELAAIAGDKPAEKESFLKSIFGK